MIVQASCPHDNEAFLDTKVLSHETNPVDPVFYHTLRASTDQELRTWVAVLPMHGVSMVKCRSHAPELPFLQLVLLLSLQLMGTLLPVPLQQRTRPPLRHFASRDPLGSMDGRIKNNIEASEQP